MLNTDADHYGGSGVGNLGRVEAVEGEHSGQPAHADIALPPLGVVWLRASPVAAHGGSAPEEKPAEVTQPEAESRPEVARDVPARGKRARRN